LWLSLDFQAVILLQEGRADEAMEVTRELLQLAGPQNRVAVRSGLRLMAKIELWRGDVESATRCAERAFALLEPEGTDEPEIRLALADIAAVRGRHEEAIGQLERVLSSGLYRPVWVTAAVDLAAVHREVGRLVQARQLCTEMLREAERAGMEIQAAYAVGTLGQIDLAEGDGRSALVRLREAAAGAGRQRHRLEMEFSVGVAEAHLAQGDLAAAEAALRAAEAMTVGRRSCFVEAALQIQWAALCLARGQDPTGPLGQAESLTAALEPEADLRRKIERLKREASSLGWRVSPSRG
jgi:tetratricopeptide (TPR) repeat protein